jgi:hypothetical protein
MSFIYEKLPASGEKCLVLEPKEALFYPFNFGSDWTTLRLGTVSSFAGVNDPNERFVAETQSTRYPSCNFYYGFVYSPNNNIPYSENVVFVGISSRTGVSDTVSLGSSTINITSSTNKSIVAINSLITGNAFSNSTQMFQGVNIDSATGTGAFASANQLELHINTTSKTFRARANMGSVLSANYPSSNTSTNLLRSSMSAFSFSSFDTITGFYTSNFTETGDLLPFPDKVLIYSPFIQNRIRIHNLIVERYV